MIYKIKIRDKERREEDFIIMGDNYKPFKDHFVNIISAFNEKWLYDDSIEGKGKCLGQSLKIELLELWKSKEKFVSFGGLKMAYEKWYDASVDEHNNSQSYPACKSLKNITFMRDDNLLIRLIAENRIIENNLIEVKNEI